MEVERALSAPNSDSASLLWQGESLARQGRRAQARQCFVRVLSHQPDNLNALLWTAALEDDPQQSILYLNRALEIAPDHPQAHAGLRWAQRKLQAQNGQAARQERWAWLDTMLLSGVMVAVMVACALLTWMAWQTPETVRAASQPTATPLPTPTATATAAPIPTWTPAPTLAPTATPWPTPTTTRVVPGEPPRYTALGEKWIDIQLSTQTLTAYEGETPVLIALVSTGVAGLSTPLGEHAIHSKVRSQAMSGPGYYLPNVEYVSYFYKSYALHGTYWHNNFGHPMSHGCINMTNSDAQWIYDWAPLGTPVRVRD